ncbi:MAG: M23 family peptidase [Bacteroidetes bacterium]|nr:peptidase M23 [Rhodothermaceae bacterium RA]RMH52437.1 MAG: M23 family peptidase [Bacteroidota bacterium]
MSRNRYYHYDHESCSFVEVQPDRRRLVVRGAALFVAALLLAGGMTWTLDRWFSTPEELALQEENEILQQQLAQIEERMAGVSAELEQLAAADQDLYRALLQAEPIPEDVRQVGTGGADPYETFSRYSPEVSSLLRSTAEHIDRLERQVGLQNASFRELAELAAQREERLKQLPAIMPTDGPIVSSYGMRYHPILKVRKMHAGIDFLVHRGTPVVATGDGVIEETGYSSTYGRYVIIRHAKAGYKTLYAHLSEVPRTIRRGRAVKRGEQIGLSGNTGRSTGPHLHYEVRDLEGRTLNPVQFFSPTMTPQEYLALLKETEQHTISLD